MPVSLPVGEQFKAHAPGNLRVAYGMAYSDTDHYYIGTERQDGPGQVEEVVAPATLGLENILSIEYDLQEKLSLGLEIPIVHTEQSRELGGVKGTMTASGLGDIRAIGRYWFRSTPGGLSLYGTGGVRVPTGESDKKYQAQNGTMITQDLAAQAGTGNFAGIVEFGGSDFVSERFGISVVARYIFAPAATTVNNFRNELTGNGPEKNSDSDSFTTRLSMATPFSTNEGFLNQLAGQAIFDFAWIPENDLFGKTEGFRRAGTIVAIGPGLSYAPTPKLTFSAGAPITVYRNVRLNGGNVQEWAFQFAMTIDAWNRGN